MTVDIAPGLVLTAPGKAEWTDLAVPALDTPAGALVRPLAVAACDLDLAINTGGFPLPLPYAVGHEFVARVVEVGPDVSTVAPGAVVAVPFQISCGACANCRAGRTGDCAAVPWMSMYGLGALGGDWGGAVTDLVRVPYADAMLVPLPAGVAPATVASLDNLADAWRTVGPYLPGLAEPRVLVFGAWSIGLYAVAIARALGAEVTYVDTDPARLAIADSLGATVREAADDSRLGRFPLTVHTTARPAPLARAIGATAPGGTVVDTGIFPGDVPLPLGRMMTVGITFVTGRAHARRDIPAVLDLVAAGRLDPSVVTATVVDWADAAKAWSALAGDRAGKLVVVRPDRIG